MSEHLTVFRDGRITEWTLTGETIDEHSWQPGQGRVSSSGMIVYSGVESKVIWKAMERVASLFGKDELCSDT